MQVLGHEVGNIYTRSELKHLIQIHVENPQHQVHAIPLVMILSSIPDAVISFWMPLARLHTTCLLVWAF